MEEIMSEQASSVLVVDDDADIRANLADILDDRGYSVDTAQDGTSALALVRRRTYDLALLDLKMPGMDGVELYRRIKEIQSGTVAIIITAYVGSNTARAATDAGAWEVMAKPVDFSRLFHLIEDTLKRPSVFIVDDDQDQCRNLWDLLRERKYRVCIAHNLQQAETMLANKSYQVVLIDMKLPDGDGRQVLQRVRQMNPGAHSILITGYRGEMETAINLALEEGADTVCYKPIDVEGLLTAVGELSR
jgi:DNA-binding NtrC family response regulator